MKHDNTRQTLRVIEMANGHLRGLSKFKINFDYPISAIAGENGSGKSTLLAMSACAFHNDSTGYNPSERKNTYYTFSDFFIQSRTEEPPDGIAINYHIMHNNWYRIGEGLAQQTRKKKVGGRWNDYALRVPRNVAYFGIQRVVPHYERSAHKSYRRRFVEGDMIVENRNRIREIAGRIIGKNYTDFKVLKHRKYSLPVVVCDEVEYSGFNMGAGENAIFEILISLFEAGTGLLLVIDEIELGLHEKAQRRLVSELKKLCKEFKCQIICSTHSHVILDELPPEGRFYVEKRLNNTTIIPKISPDSACGKMSGRNTSELDLIVEDGLSHLILEAYLSYDIRCRIGIRPIGSSAALMRSIASRILEERENCIAILDGDQSTNKLILRNQIRAYSEASTKDEKKLIDDWMDAKVDFLPGENWPEKWLFDSMLAQLKGDGDTMTPTIMESWALRSNGQLIDKLEEALRAGKHREFAELSKGLNCSDNQIKSDVVRFVKFHYPDELNSIIDKICLLLNE
ncbi:MAG: ATP-binding protein [Hyphomicrobiales bacterium]